MEKKTAGQISNELVQQDVHGDITAGERMQQMLSEYEQYLHDAVDRGKAQYVGDFFVTVLTKREKLLSTTFRNYFIPRQSCPTPTHDQTVFHYQAKKENLEYLWSLPSPVAIKNILAHKHELDPSMFPLLRFVLNFLDGTLDRLTQKLNGEDLIIQ